MMKSSTNISNLITLWAAKYCRSLVIALNYLFLKQFFITANHFISLTKQDNDEHFIIFIAVCFYLG